MGSSNDRRHAQSIESINQHRYDASLKRAELLEQFRRIAIAQAFGVPLTPEDQAALDTAIKNWAREASRPKLRPFAEELAEIRERARQQGLPNVP